MSWAFIQTPAPAERGLACSKTFALIGAHRKAVHLGRDQVAPGAALWVKPARLAVSFQGPQL